MAEVEAEVGSSLEPKAPTWAKSLAMEKRLDALGQQIADLNKIIYPHRASAVEYPKRGRPSGRVVKGSRMSPRGG